MGSITPRLLTKSRFKEALDCPTKLFYTHKKGQYTNAQIEDTFLESLAQGGFQVEELARMYYPSGHAILGNDHDYEHLAAETAELLKKENVTIFEAAFLYDGLFIRVDILNKKGNQIQVIEVKAKSISGKDHKGFIRKGKLNSGWTPYLYDIAFQQHVVGKCLPNAKVEAFLMLADKDKKATVDGVNQQFKISKKAGNRTGIIRDDNLKKEDLGEPLLAKISVKDEIGFIQENNPVDANRTFEDLIEHYRDHYARDVKIFNEIGSQCKSCQFQDDKDREKSGFHTCWSEQLNLPKEEVDKPKVYDISGFRRAKKLMEEDKFFMDQVTENDIDPKPEAGKLSTSERQWLQIEKELSGDTEPVFERKGLQDEIRSWKYPLNFIDFETSAVALPFTKGRRPYEQLAFQYSHHIVYPDGRVEHSNEYLNTAVGVFPNFDFIRSLKSALETNDGSIFRYHAHENTILNAIHAQLFESNEPDRAELMEFIELISHNTGKNAFSWNGERDMIDLWRVVKDYYYDPYTKGSNSIKDVLPAVLHSSEFLRKKYSKPLLEINLTSKNFDPNHVFLELENDKPVSPYKLLPPLFENWNQDDLDKTVTEIEGISDGGAALTAYGKLQFEEVSDEEREAIESGLLKYCELDTLAMVMIYEYFVEVLQLADN
jgi:hypothetical protein